MYYSLYVSTNFNADSGHHSISQLKQVEYQMNECCKVDNQFCYQSLYIHLNEDKVCLRKESHYSRKSYLCLDYFNYIISYFLGTFN